MTAVYWASAEGRVKDMQLLRDVAEHGGTTSTEAMGSPRSQPFNLCLMMNNHTMTTVILNFSSSITYKAGFLKAPPPDNYISKA